MPKTSFLAVVPGPSLCPHVKVIIQSGQYLVIQTVPSYTLIYEYDQTLLCYWRRRFGQDCCLFSCYRSISSFLAMLSFLLVVVTTTRPVVTYTTPIPRNQQRQCPVLPLLACALQNTVPWGSGGGHGFKSYQLPGIGLREVLV